MKKIYCYLLLLPIILFVVSCGGGGGGGVILPPGTVTGSATLTWTPPTLNDDGTALTDLSGYNVYYGTKSGHYTHTIDVGNVTTHKVTGLPAGATYYFAVTAYNASRVESAFSTEAHKKI